MRQNAVVEAVGVGQNETPELAQLAPRVGVGVAIIDGGVDAFHASFHFSQLGQLVFDERLRGIEEQSCCPGMLEEMVEYRQLKGKTFSTRRGADDRYVVTVLGLVETGALEGIQLADPLVCKISGQVGIHSRRQRGKRRFPSVKVESADNLAVI